MVETNVQCMTMVKMHTDFLTFQYWLDNEIIFGVLGTGSSTLSA